MVMSVLPALMALIVLAVPPTPEHTTVEVIQADLRLELSYDGPEEIDPWQPLQMTLAIRNASETTPHPVVMPGDGSWFGWREPSMTFEWQSFDPGEAGWTPIPRDMIGRCGNYDAEWRDEVVVIDPGGSADLAGWTPSARQGAHLSGHDRVRVRARYAYGARSPENATRLAGAPVPEGPMPASAFGPMGYTPPFVLTSEWVELAVRPALSLSCRQVRPVPMRGSIDLLEHFEVTLTNSTRRPFTLYAPRTGQERELLTTLDVSLGHVINGSFALRPEDASAPIVLEPGESISVTSLLWRGGTRKPHRIEPDRQALRSFDGTPIPYSVAVYRGDWDWMERLVATGVVELGPAPRAPAR
jgi:hypothetical protein